MERAETKDNRKTRVVCPKCKAFLFEIKPWLSPSQEVIVYCRRCKSEHKIN